MSDELNNHDSAEIESEEDELSHTDKLAGLFTEPSSTFQSIAKFPPKVIDWLLVVVGSGSILYGIWLALRIASFSG